jgi:hypothetical protein
MQCAPENVYASSSSFPYESLNIPILEGKKRKKRNPNHKRNIPTSELVASTLA